MAKIYASLIKKGLKTIDDVPENLRDEVRAPLEEQDDPALQILAQKGGEQHGSHLRRPDRQGQAYLRQRP